MIFHHEVLERPWVIWTAVADGRLVSALCIVQADDCTLHNTSNSCSCRCLESWKSVHSPPHSMVSPGVNWVRLILCCDEGERTGATLPQSMFTPMRCLTEAFAHVWVSSRVTCITIYVLYPDEIDRQKLNWFQTLERKMTAGSPTWIVGLAINFENVQAMASIVLVKSCFKTNFVSEAA